MKLYWKVVPWSENKDKEDRGDFLVGPREEMQI